MRIATLMLALGVCGGALAEESRAPTQRGDLGVRYWVTTGETKRAHNARNLDASLGNPTSVLTYENLDAHVVELFGRQNFGDRWFLKGNLGVGRVNSGALDDEDYLAGQVKWLDTTSSIREGRIGYGTIDIGRNEWVLRGGRSVLGVFIGYSQWTEDVDAYGVTATVDAFALGVDLPDSIIAISNKVTWKSLRVGFAADIAIGERLRLALDLALVPYTRMRDEDSHHLRTDPTRIDFLGPVPNVILEGTGRGVQLDGELRYALRPRTEIALGARYWYLEATKGTRSVPAFPGSESPTTELYSRRVGATLSLRRTW